MNNPIAFNHHILTQTTKIIQASYYPPKEQMRKSEKVMNVPKIPTTHKMTYKQANRHARTHTYIQGDNLINFSQDSQKASRLSSSRSRRPTPNFELTKPTPKIYSNKKTSNHRKHLILSLSSIYRTNKLTASNNPISSQHQHVLNWPSWTLKSVSLQSPL